MKAFLYEFGLAAKQGPRLYFAPFVGAVKAIKAELRRSDLKASAKKAPKDEYRAKA